MADDRETSPEVEGPGLDVSPMPVPRSKPTEEQKQQMLNEEGEAIRQGEELERFLNTPIVKEAFTRLGKAYTAEWLAAETVQERENIWALSRALLDVAKDLRSVFVRGRTAKATRQRRQARETAAEKRKQR